MRTLFLAGILIGACLFMPGCLQAKEQMLCEGEESLEENSWYECKIELYDDVNLRIDVEVTGDTPITILTIPAYSYDDWYYCEEFSSYSELSEVDSMGASLEKIFRDPTELYVIFWNSDYPNSCDEEENGDAAHFSFKVSV